MKRPGVLLLFAFVFACCARSALAEPAWVKTEKGPLNMRRRADSKASVIERIPNGELIEADEAEDGWSLVSYAGKEGYVKSGYLSPASQMIGKAIYPDGDYLYIRKDADEGAECVAVVQAAQAITILSVNGHWAWVSFQEEAHKKVYGYVSIQHISKQRETPGEHIALKLPVGIELSTDSLQIGEVLDVSLRCDGEAAYQYRLYLEDEILFDGQPVAHNTASYRPRQAGRYRLEVIVHDVNGHTGGCEAFFDVQTADASNPAQEFKRFHLYSQEDGWWRDKKYGRKNLESSGCAIFTLSHGLEMTGHADSAAARPESLAETYANYLVQSGTLNSRMLASAAEAFGFLTDAEKIGDPSDIVRWFKEGAVFSFLVVKGHVALAAGLSGDGSKVRIIDSAPSATFERITNASVYYLDAQGAFRAAQTPWDIPGARYYFETDAFGGLKYYLDLDYVAGRGVRLIGP